MKKLFSSLLILLLGLLIAPNAFAHVTVKPTEIGLGARANFVVSVPTEEDVPTTEVRLVIPNGIKSVRPNAKPGWTIEIKRIGESMKGAVLNTGQPAPDPETVTEIVWSGGSIPVEMRDEFVFSAQAPSEATSLSWKAYQTYANGEVVAWDADPKTVEDYAKANPTAGDDDHNAPKPFSVTKVTNDLATNTLAPATSGETVSVKSDGNSSFAIVLSIAAIALAGTSLYLQTKKRK